MDCDAACLGGQIDIALNLIGFLVLSLVVLFTMPSDDDSGGRRRHSASEAVLRAGIAAW